MIAFACVIVWLSTQDQLPTQGDTVGSAVFGMTILMGVIAGASAAVTGLILIASGELILLFIDVERNTRGAEHYAEKTQQAMAALLKAVTKPRDKTNPPTPAPVPPSPQPVRQVAP
jgi:hypothetical protein